MFHVNSWLGKAAEIEQQSRSIDSHRVCKSETAISNTEDYLPINDSPGFVGVRGLPMGKVQ